MQISINALTEHTISFTLTNSTISFANSLRRTILSDIPTLSIDLVEIIKNCTVIPDEMIAHRLGFIPIKNLPLIYKEECDCSEVCNKCGIRGTIDVYNHNNLPITITSEDIKFIDESGYNTVVLSSNCIIAKLSFNQSLQLSFIVRKNTAQTHSKYCPVTVVNFLYDENNSTRHTEYWYESDKNKEWPGLKEGVGRMDEVSVIKMGFECVEGIMNSKEVLMAGLNILKEKVDLLISNLEEYETN